MLKKLLIGAMVIAATISPVVAVEPTEVEKVKAALVEELTTTVKAATEEAKAQNLTQEETKEVVQAAVVETTKAFARRAKMRNERLVAALIGGVLGAVVVGGAVYLFVARPAKLELDAAKAQLAAPSALGPDATPAATPVDEKAAAAVQPAVIPSANGNEGDQDEEK